MEKIKQSKVLNKINKGSGTVDKLKTAQKAKFDEFYTQRIDIDNELVHWADKFKGKDIICPCDFDVVDDENIYKVVIEFGDEYREFLGERNYKVRKVTVTSEGIATLKVKQDEEEVELDTFIDDSIDNLKCTAYKQLPDSADDEWEPGQHSIKNEVVYEGKEAQEFIKTKIYCNFVRSLIAIGSRERSRIHTITASGYDVDSGKGERFQDIDYSQYDICITNPPFSVYSEFMDVMINESNKRKHSNKPFNFIALAPQQNRTNTNVGGRLMTHECYLGYGRMLPMNFSNPDKSSNYTSKQVSVDWITTFSDAQDEIDKTKLHTGIKFADYGDEYPICPDMTMKDGTHPIRCKSKTAIPEDYKGWMFVPVSVLNELSNEEFEWYVTNCHKQMNDMYRAGTSPFNHLVFNTMYKDSNGEGGFGGIVMRRK